MSSALHQHALFLKYPPPNGLADAGMAANTCCHIVAVGAFLQILISVVHLWKPDMRTSKYLVHSSLIIQVLLSLGFAGILILIRLIYKGEWKCDNPLLKTLTIEDHFVYNYFTYV